MENEPIFRHTVRFTAMYAVSWLTNSAALAVISDERRRDRRKDGSRPPTDVTAAGSSRQAAIN